MIQMIERNFYGYERACLIGRDRRERSTLQRIIALSIPPIITVCCYYYFDLASKSTLLLMQRANGLMIVIRSINKRMLINQPAVSVHKCTAIFEEPITRELIRALSNHC